MFSWYNLLFSYLNLKFCLQTDETEMKIHRFFLKICQFQNVEFCIISKFFIAIQNGYFCVFSQEKLVKFHIGLGSVMFIKTEVRVLCPSETLKKSEVVLMSLLLTFEQILHFSSVSIFAFEQINVCQAGNGRSFCRVQKKSQAVLVSLMLPFKHILHTFLVFLFLPLNKYMFAGQAMAVFFAGLKYEDQ